MIKQNARSLGRAWYSIDTLLLILVNTHLQLANVGLLQCLEYCLAYTRIFLGRVLYQQNPKKEFVSIITKVLPVGTSKDQQ